MHDGYSDSLIVSTDVIELDPHTHQHVIVSRVLWWPALSDMSRYPLHVERSFLAAVTLQSVPINNRTVDLLSCARDPSSSSSLSKDVGSGAYQCGVGCVTDDDQVCRVESSKCPPLQDGKSNGNAHGDAKATRGMSVGLSRLGQTLFCSARIEQSTWTGITLLVAYNPFSGCDIRLRLVGHIPADARAPGGLFRLALAGRIRIVVDGFTQLPRSVYRASLSSPSSTSPLHRPERAHCEAALQRFHDFVRRSFGLAADRCSGGRTRHAQELHDSHKSSSRCFGTCISGPPGSDARALGRALMQSIPPSSVCLPPIIMTALRMRHGHLVCVFCMSRGVWIWPSCSRTMSARR